MLQGRVRIWSWTPRTASVRYFVGPSSIHRGGGSDSNQSVIPLCKKSGSLTAIKRVTMDTSTRCGAKAQSDEHVTLVGLGGRAVDAAGAERTIIPTATSSDGRSGSLDRARPLPDVAGHVVGPDRATRGGM